MSELINTLAPLTIEQASQRHEDAKKVLADILSGPHQLYIPHIYAFLKQNDGSFHHEAPKIAGDKWYFEVSIPEDKFSEFGDFLNKIPGCTYGWKQFSNGKHLVGHIIDPTFVPQLLDLELIMNPPLPGVRPHKAYIH